MREQQNSLRAVILTGLFAAIIYLGIWVLRIPVPALVGKPFIHFGNTLTAVAILFLGCRNGMLAGMIGLGGFDILNGYASVSWLTMLEVVVVALIISGLFKAFKYNDSKRNIVILSIAAGVTKIFTSYATSIVEALMAGTAIKTALVASFFSLPATAINSCSTAICTPILYFFVKSIFNLAQKQKR
ncbi:Uncharacterized membrane protein [Ligilactobacillus sp. WC1T17]|uniref:Uncharacterized membrane protein n=1 Tax=Ligilactobacillus ruminis TaxID=1623 RepID=A0ABY1A923_9LACO|nr:Uncharacterized membrane protein [Ligilactobacillus ruminis]